jgi:hypothetical protein
MTMDLSFRLYCDHPRVSEGINIRVTLSTLSVSLPLANAGLLAQVVIINMTGDERGLQEEEKEMERLKTEGLKGFFFILL